MYQLFTCLVLESNETILIKPLLMAFAIMVTEWSVSILTSFLPFVSTL